MGRYFAPCSDMARCEMVKDIATNGPGVLPTSLRLQSNTCHWRCLLYPSRLLEREEREKRNFAFLHTRELQV
jgi:hypothetical protein